MKRSAILVLSLLVVLALPTALYAEDTTSPDTTITSGPSGTIDYGNVTFEWTGSDDVTATEDLIYSYKLEGEDDSWSNWTYDTSTTYETLKNKSYTFKVKAKDETENIDPTPAERSFSVDSTDPGMGKWSFESEGRIGSSPAIASDGTIYFGSRDNLYALETDGTKKWMFEAEEYFGYSSPTVGPGGTIYVGNSDGTLYAVNPDGTKKWVFHTGASVTASPAIASDGTIYVGSEDQKLYAINPNGTEKWKFETEDEIGSSPTIGPNGTVYVSSGFKFHAIHPDGTKKWSFSTRCSPISSPAIGPEGTIYIGACKLNALNYDGTEKWSFEPEGWMRSSPTIASDGTIYVGSRDRRLYAINPNGTEKWALKTEGELRSSPAIASDGTIYVGSEDGNLYAINSDGTKKWPFSTGDRVESSPVIGPDGTIYVGSHDENLYAIYGGSEGPADSSWPMFQRDARHTGRASDVTLLPIVDFTYSPDDPSSNETITFDASSSSSPDGSITQYKWDWDDDGTYDDSSSSPTIDQTFSSPGDYPVTLKVIDTEDNSNTTIQTISFADGTPPNPNPMSWSTKPYATGKSSIGMEASQATDPEGNGVEYYFKETTGNTDGDDSGWQDDPTYTDRDLEPHTQYCYMAKARDKSGNQNETDWSENVCLTAGLAVTLPSGWNIISPPGLPQNSDPAMALGDDYEPLTLYYDYSPADGYTNYPNDTDSTQLSWRQGYWMYLNRETQLSMATDVPDQSKTIQFTSTGWNLMGVPYSVDWGHASFSNPQDFETDGAGHVRIVSWNTAESKYLNHYSGTSYVLPPWTGYWIYVNSASSSDPAEVTVSYTLQPPSTPDTQIPLPKSIERKELDYPPQPPVYDHSNEPLEVFAYPNPVSNTRTVVFRPRGSSERIEKIKTEVFDAGGYSLWQGQSSGTRLTWELKGVPNGIYLYKPAVKVDGEWKNLEIARLLVIK